MPIQMFQKLLVANRGEIAIRVLRAASELKIRTVAIYTYEDRYSLHRYKADEAYQIGDNNDPLKPYLNIEKIIEVAKMEGVDCIHPGYGFLSENVLFASRCREEGICFVGPDPEVMARLGDKIMAKKMALEMQVPVIEDSQIPLANVSLAISEASRIGFPVIIKASAGGGGRGMRVVRNAGEMEKSFNEAQREAITAFGDGTLFIEKFIDQPKHIEVQILGDKQGNIVHLFERDCSVQRRFQKVIEVAPAPTLRQETKDRLYFHALRLARHVGYNNAGTVEFLVDQEENVFFIEVNPRIQVEHTVTEEITGIDLVRSQILIAAGHSLKSPFIHIPNQESITCQGVAIQCRITTEDPESEFKPDYGTIIAYRNAGGYGIRIDEGSCYPGVRISPFFDSMLVKVTAKGRTMKGTTQRLLRALAEFRVRGVKTNIQFLENVLAHPLFQKGEARVNFIGDHPELFVLSRKHDSGTRALKYLANVVVNGNPDVKAPNKGKVFLPASLPSFSTQLPAPDGTKQLLEKLGPAKFANQLKADPQIHYTDCTLRDAHQSLLATRVRTKDMVSFARAFSHLQPELFSMEVWGGATFDVALRFLHEDPWQRLELLRAAVPNILLQMLIRGSNAIGYTAYPDNLVEKFIVKSSEKGIDLFRIFDSLNSLENMRVSIDAVIRLTKGIAEPCICYTGDILNKDRPKFNLNYYLDLAKRIEDTGAHILGIKDMAGLLKPYAAELLVGELKNHIKMPIHLHSHDTSGMQSATYLKAVEAGVDVVDVALASMSGLTSQPNANSFMEAMKGHRRNRETNMETLNAFSNYWENVREYYYPFESDMKAGTAEVYKHEIPGGQYSNLKPQAQSLGLLERMDEIKQAYADANELFGDIIKVTPSSKVVGDLAMFMVSNRLTKEDVLEKASTLSFPDSVKGMLRGDLGQPDGGWPADFQSKVLKGEKPYTDLPNKHLKPLDFEKALSAFRKKYDEHQTECDFLSYSFYPKVFDEYYKHLQKFGQVTNIPTPAFFYGLENGEEVMIEIERGKTILVRLLQKGDPDEEGIRTVFFKLNGQNRFVEVKDNSVNSKKISNTKVSGGNQVGTPLQGILSKLFVKEGDSVKVDMPLFTIEAMKMESTITSSLAGRIKKIWLSEGTYVETADLVVEFE